MKELYIWFNRTQLPKGYPLQSDFILKSQFDLEQPRKIYDEKWKMYNRFNSEYSTGEFQFPCEMFMVVTKKKYKEIDFDYYSCDVGISIKFVSESFLNFLSTNGIDENYYKQAKLNVIDLSGNSLVSKNYYALRFIKSDDTLFDFQKDTFKRAAGIRNHFLYPFMELKRNIVGKNVFSLFEFCYEETLILNEVAKEYVLKHFSNPQLYKAEDYPLIFNNQRDYEMLPYNNSYLIHC